MPHLVQFFYYIDIMSTVTNNMMVLIAYAKGHISSDEFVKQVGELRNKIDNLLRKLPDRNL